MGPVMGVWSSDIGASEVAQQVGDGVVSVDDDHEEGGPGRVREDSGGEDLHDGHEAPPGMGSTCVRQIPPA